jgi:hypothetical protein
MLLSLAFGAGMSVKTQEILRSDKAAMRSGVDQAKK